MSYYWFNKKVLLQKAKGRYHKCGGKEKATKYYVEKKRSSEENAKRERKRKRRKNRIWRR